jgi:hypothetical protein
MQFPKCLAAVAVLLAASAEAAPVSGADTTLYKSHPSALFDKRGSINHCGESTFENKSSRGSPTVSDCLQITRNIAGGGTWRTAHGYHRQLVQHGTCAFGVDGDSGSYLVGNQDIINLINDSVRQFQWKGLVGAKGVMGCQGGSPLEPAKVVYWGIYHTRMRGSGKAMGRH